MLLSACSLPLSTDIRLTDATPIHYSSTHLRPPLSLSVCLAGWLAGCLMAVKSTISVRAFSRVPRASTVLQYILYSSPWP